MKKININNHYLRMGLLFLLGSFYIELAYGYNSAYEDLKKMLPMYEKAIQSPWQTISSNEKLEKNTRHPAVILLRQRLCKTHDMICDSPDSQQTPVFDAKVDNAVRLFQERHNLKPDGIVGKATRQALNISPQSRLNQIHLNLTRWAKLSDSADTEPRYIWINVPDYRLRLVDNHQAVLTFPVIVGKPGRQTPEIDSKINRVILNPFWYVPPTILRNDMIPKAMANPQYLNSLGIRIFSLNNTHQELKANQMNWSDIKRNPSRYIFRQDPGPKNALGQIKFEFYNPHLIYLHDTPSKELFMQEKRLLSSGCIRLKDPINFLSYLTQWDSALKQQVQNIKNALQSGKTTIFKLDNPVAIHVTYITAWVDKRGILHFWDDVYQQDHRLLIQQKNAIRDLPQPV